VMGIAPNYWLRAIEKSSSPAGLVRQVQAVSPPSNSPPQNPVSASIAPEAKR